MIDADTRDIIIRTVWGEARGEGAPGQIAVAWVIKNRVDRFPGSWWGKTYKDVCLHPWQFSCWKLETVKLQALSTSDNAYIAIGVTVDSVFSDTPTPDPTGGCCFYKVTGTSSTWGKGVEPKIIIGHQAFYDLGPMD